MYRSRKPSFIIRHLPFVNETGQSQVVKWPISSDKWHMTNSQNAHICMFGDSPNPTRPVLLNRAEIRLHTNELDYLAISLDVPSSLCLFGPLLHCPTMIP
jgi:hypothetical protein